MYVTSIENIRKVIDPLFFDELSLELEAIAVKKIRDKKLRDFEKKLAGLPTREISILSFSENSGIIEKYLVVV